VMLTSGADDTDNHIAATPEWIENIITDLDLIDTTRLTDSLILHYTAKGVPCLCTGMGCVATDLGLI
jgi:hypothetical protein